MAGYVLNPGRIAVASVAVAILVLHAVCIAVSSSHVNAASYPFLILSPLLALAACVRRATRCPPGHTRTAWYLLCAGVLLWIIGIGLSAWEDIFLQANALIAQYSDFVFFLYGAPLLLAVSSPTLSRRARMFFWLDCIQFGLAGYLAYVLVFSAQPFEQQPLAPISNALLERTYGIENLILAASAALRLWSHLAADEERRYYLILTSFLWIYGLCATLYNMLTVAAPEGNAMRDLIADIPFLLLALAALLPPVAAAGDSDIAQRSSLALFIDNFSPIFFTVGLLLLGISVIPTYFHLGTLAVFVALAVHALRSTTLQNRYMRTERALREARDKLEQQTLTDGLTGVANRRCLDRMLTLEWQQAMQRQTPLALLMVDIDFFKSLNDTYGHPFGDACLIKVATALQQHLPEGNTLLARYGGEEFVALLPGATGADAHRTASAMQAAVAALDINSPASQTGHVTVSIGLALADAAHQSTPAALLAAADHALYRAKQNGRNRIESASDADSAQPMPA